MSLWGSSIWGGSGSSLATPPNSTYTIADALSIANRAISRPVEDDHAAYIANIALNEVWLAYDWRVTIAALPPFWIIPLRQDYGAPFYAVPQDFYGLRTAYLVQTTSTPPRRSELTILKNIRKEFMRGYPRNIGYVPETKSLRIYPVVPENLGATQFLIDGTYKTRAPQVTSGTLQSTAVPWDDIYIQHFISALRWAAAEVADAPNKNQKKQELYAGLADMAMREGLELGDQVVSPSEALVGSAGLGYFPGLGTGLF